MGRFIDRGKFAVILLSVFFAGLLWMGCSNTVKRDDPAASTPSSAPQIHSMAKYYFFDDILVPNELEYDQKKSYVYETPQFKTGALYFSKWRVDTDSLFNFFLLNMDRDGWKMVTSYRGKESHLTFYKLDRGCTIRITESWLGTAHVEIRVGPADVKKN
jgi:hypothetical protein